MSLAVKIIYTIPGSPEKLVLAQFGLDNNYPAGGYVLSPAMFTLSAFSAQYGPATGLSLPVMLSGSGGGGTPLMADVDQATGALRVYYPTGGANAAPAAPADPVASGAPAVGAVAVTSTVAQPTIASALTPGRAKEVAAGTNLTGFLVVLMAVGH